MFYLLALVLFLFLRFLCPTIDPEVSLAGWAAASYIISGIVLMIALLTQIGKYYWQVHDIEEVVEQKQNRKVYVKRAAEYIDEFRIHLAETYPKHEKKLFKLMKPENVTAFMIKYPEIKANETITKLVDTINSLKDNYYRCDTQINKLSKQIRIRKRTMLMTCLPILPVYKEESSDV